MKRTRRLVHALWLTTMLLLLLGVGMHIEQGAGAAVLGLVVGLPVAMYGTVGALVARRRPENAIGWLFGAISLSLALWISGTAYGGVGAEPESFSALPGAAAAAWIGVLTPVAVLCVALPAFLLVFPDGRLRSPRWRSAVAVAAVGAVLAAAGMAGTVDRYSGKLPLVPPGWLRAIPAIESLFAAGILLAAGAGAAGLVSLWARYRQSEGERREQLRLLVWILVAMVAVLPMTFLGWIGLILVFLVDGGGILFGIPAATAIAVLTFGLYDVGVVLKKTIVYGLIVVVLTLFLGLVIFAVAPLGVRQGDGGPVARIATGLAFVGLTIAATWRLVRRAARRMVYGKRATPYEAVSAFSDRLGEAYSTEDVLPRMARILRAGTGADVVRVWLRIGDELRPAAAAPPEPQGSTPLRLDGGELPAFEPRERAFPVRHQGELLGAVSVRMPASEPLRAGGEKLVLDLASQGGLVLRNVRLIEELQESRRRIVAAQDERARKLERDIHDGAQQQLVALSVKLGLAEQLLSRDPDKAAAILAELKRDAADTLDNLRDLARGIYPPLLADEGLEAALTAQATKSSVPLEVDARDTGRFSPEIEAAVYFCALEALQNIAKYAHATRATVRVSASNGDLSFAIEDDGEGFDPTGARGSGLTNMRDRVEALGGSLEVRSSPGSGAVVSGRIPVGASP